MKKFDPSVEHLMIPFNVAILSIYSFVWLYCLERFLSNGEFVSGVVFFGIMVIVHVVVLRSKSFIFHLGVGVSNFIPILYFL